MLPIFMMATFAFSSCSNDDDDKGGDASLIGTWIYEDDDYEEMYTFNANGTGRYFYSDEYIDEDYSFSWKADDKTVTITAYGDTDTMPYKVVGNKLYLDGDEYYRR